MPRKKLFITVSILAALLLMPQMGSYLVLEHELRPAAASIREEARAAGQYLLQNPHIRSVILVSSAPHMRRATMTFRREFRRGGIPCAIIPRASKYSDFQEKQWWKHRESARAVAGEYVKMVFSR